jgi:heat shock protein HslJ
MNPARVRIATVATFLILALGSTSSAGTQARGTEQLFGRPYVSVSVMKDGTVHHLFDRAVIRVAFEHRDGSDVVRWRAECNHFGAPVEITDQRLETGQISNTTMRCTKRLGRQDRWIGRFFWSNPEWRAGDGRLRLEAAGDRVIKLRRGQ